MILLIFSVLILTTLGLDDIIQIIGRSMPCACGENFLKMLKQRPITKIIILLLLAPLLIFAQQSGEIDASKPLLKLTVIDVWQGDSMLAELPSGNTVLIDAGMGFSEYQKFDAGISKVIPLLIKKKIPRIDYMVWTHPHNDHIGGIPAVLEKFQVNRDK